MDHLEDQDVIRLKELLRRTGEFIAYFEFAETKMVEWRQDIEQQASLHEQQFQQKLHALRTELSTVEEIFTQAGLARFRMVAETALQQVVKHISNHQREITTVGETVVEQIAAHANEALALLSAKLAEFDAQNFQKIAHHSCDQVEKSAQNAINKSSKILRLFHWRSAALVFLATVISAFAIGLYLNNEYPWEIHQHVINERDAGKMLMNAWPKLTDQEKVKILGERAQG